tara:strand:- start:413 stop:628 length:216 start_codon:yes stop_codon:yes gene_type:complete
MEDLIDLIATDGSASDVSDKIKDILYAKSAERIDQLKAPVANSMFNDVEEVEEIETEEPDQEPTAELETEE